MIEVCAISVSLWKILHTENGVLSLFLIFKFQITQKLDLIARNGKRYRNQREKYFQKHFCLFMFMAKIHNLFSSVSNDILKKFCFMK